MPGLYFVVQPSGAKSWAVRYRYDKQTRKHTIGPYPRIGLKAARELGSAALRAAAEGRDPGQEKKQTSKAARPATIEAAVRQFLDTHCKRNQRRSTQKETERLLRLYVLSRWASPPLAASPAMTSTRWPTESLPTTSRFSPTAPLPRPGSFLTGASSTG